jgi:hypothetical protein
LSTTWAKGEIAHEHQAVQAIFPIQNGMDTGLAEAEQTQLDALAVALRPDATGRHRFVIPSIGQVKASPEVTALAKGLGAKQTVADLKAALDSLAKAMHAAALHAESQSDLNLAYRLRWLSVGYQAITTVPSRTSKPNLVWSQSDALGRSKQIAKGFSNQAKTLWPAGSYTQLSTTHFDIVSQSGPKPTEEMAELCEQTYAVWKQMFPDFWMNEQIAAPEYFAEPSGRFTVAMYRDAAAYRKALQGQSGSISQSTGYYDPNRKLAMFYWDGPKTTSTVVHELTHQFFQESNQETAKLDTNRGQGFLVLEGIALYMESMSLRRCGNGTIADVGGWDSTRLQSARYRRLHDEFWIEWNDFHSVTGEQLRSKKDIGAWYSQAVGLTHLWMDGDEAMQKSFCRYLQSIYRGTPDVSLLGKLANDDLLRTAYDEYLQRTARDSRTYSEDRNEVVLSHCPIGSQTLLDWPIKCRKLKWLDVSFTKVDDQLFELDDSKWNSVRLNLESTAITDRSMMSIAQMSSLDDLDLSNCNVTDAGVALLKGNKSLRTLWLSGCDVSNASIDILLTLPQLDSVHVQQTKITLAGWNRLIQAKPRLKSKSTPPN